MPRTKRRTDNHKLFREVNERIAELWNAFDEREEPLSIVCECWRVGCMERGSVPLDVYSRARDSIDLFVVVRGHDDPAYEQTVEDHGGFVIVKPHENEARGRGAAPADPADAELSAAPLPS